MSDENKVLFVEGQEADDEDLMNNPSTRLPVCLVIDISSSMDTILDDLSQVTPSRQEFRDGKMWNIYEGDFQTYMTNMISGINKFYDAIKSNPLASASCEIAIVAFSDSVKVLENFENVNRKLAFMDPGRGDNTNLGLGVKTALDLLEERKQTYKDYELPYLQPWIVIFTDGVPTDIDETKAAQARCIQLQKEEKLTVFTFALGEGANLDVLRGFHYSDSSSPFNGPINLDSGDKIEACFKFLGKSASMTTEGKELNTDDLGFDTENF